MQLTQRQGTLIVMGVQSAGILITILSLIGVREPWYLAILSGVLLAYLGVSYAYYRGVAGMEYVLVGLVAAVTIATTSLDNGFNIAALGAPIVALVALTPFGVAVSAIVVLAALIVRGGGSGSYADPEGITFYVMLVGSMIVARMVLDAAHRREERHAAEVEAERERVKAQAAQLAESNTQQDDQIKQLQRLMELVATLETPAVEIAEGVALAPVVGVIDSQRAQKLTERLLEVVHQRRTRLVILDIAGVSMVDTAVAKSFIQTAQSLRLLGCNVVFSGISSSVAATIVSLGIDMDGIVTVRSPQDALARYPQLQGTRSVTANTPRQFGDHN